LFKEVEQVDREEHKTLDDIFAAKKKRGQARKSYMIESENESDTERDP